MAGVRLLVLFLLLLIALSGAACREEGEIQISSLDFQGVEQVDEGALADALQTRRGSRLPWGRKRFFDRSAFQADLQRIQAFYRDRGFPDARVTSFDVQLNDAQDKVDVIVNISEGEPIVVSEVVLNGFDPLSDSERDMLLETLPLQPERPLDRQAAVAARERTVNALRDVGYPYAAVTMTEEEPGPRRRRIVLQAMPGVLAHFGEVEIVGVSSVSENVIRRELTFDPGDVFTRQAMRETQRSLYRLELFEFVNVESLEDQRTQSPQVPVRVTVAEGKHQKVTLGAGYGTEERLRGTIRWDHVNFLRDARHLGVEAKWSSLDRGIRLDFREPYFLTRGVSLNFDGQAWQAREGQATEGEPLYSFDSLGGRATLRHDLTTQTFWSLSLLNEFQRSEISNAALLDFTVRDELIALGLDPRTGVSSGTLSAVAFDVSRNTTGNILDARSGYVASGHVEQAGSWLWGTYNYWSVTAEARHYLPVGRRFVAANRLRVGTIDGGTEPGANVPFRKRYFLGGSSSIRGWGRYEISPLSGFGLPIGGHTMLEGSTEARVPLFGKLGAVAFLDYGNVWSGSWDFQVRDLRYAAGGGLRYTTPIGPVRVDIGRQLNPIENLRVNGEISERYWRLHFSVGQAF
jgi:outer membrane protein assembly complex protein YaeT